MATTTQQLKDLLGKVTQGWWVADGLSKSGLPSAYINAADGYPVARAVGVVSEFETEANATLIALSPTLAAEVVRLRDLINNAKRILNREAILALPSEYDEDEQWMVDGFSMRVDLESCRQCVRDALQAIDDTSAK